MKQFKGKVAVVTGSSQGIGKAIATALLKNGCSVIINGRNKERLLSTLNSLKDFSNELDAFAADVSVPEEAQSLINYAIQRFGQLNILINNVGVSMRGKIGNLNPEVFKKVFESNIYGSINPTIYALPYIRKTKGSVVFIGSLAGIRGIPNLSAYCSSKMALRAICESLKIEEAEHHVHVGLIQVGMTQIAHNKETISSDGSMQKLKARTQSARIQSMDHVAEQVLRNIQKRSFISTLTIIGRLNAFLQSLSPRLVELIIKWNKKKFELAAE